MKKMDKKFDFKLDDEELQILEDIENGDYVSLKETNPKKFEEKKAVIKLAAENTIKRLTKKKSYTMKLIENDVESIKVMALKKGLPYQTFIASIIHQIATKQIRI